MGRKKSRGGATADAKRDGHGPKVTVTPAQAALLERLQKGARKDEQRKDLFPLQSRLPQLWDVLECQSTPHILKVAKVHRDCPQHAPKHHSPLWLACAPAC